MKRATTAVLLGLVALGGPACSDRTPTSVDPDLLPTHPASVEVRLPWDQFGSNLQVYGGYGALSDVGAGYVAHAFGGTLEARTLARFAEIPTSATVTDSTGTSRTDTLLALTGGRVVAKVDTAGSVTGGPVTLQLGFVRQRWDRYSASWTMAVDTTGDEVAWDEPGAGPVEEITTAVWDRSASGDSVVFLLDSAQVEMWRDTSEVDQGAVVGLLTEGARLKVTSVNLRAVMKPSSRPDTLIDLGGGGTGLTFVYAPEPGPPGSDIRVGGVPAWRTAMDIDVPTQLDGPPSLCAVATCPLKLTPTRLNYAALVLTTRRGETAFRPSDSLGVDVRVIYDRSAMPKSPLGSSLLTPQGLPFGTRVGAGLFSTGESQVEVPITTYVRSVLAGDSTGGFPPPRSLALLSPFEPASLTFASFFGPGTQWAPVLKLVVTAGGSVQLP